MNRKTLILLSALIISASCLLLYPHNAAAKCAIDTDGGGCDENGSVTVQGHYQCISCQDGYHATVRTESNGYKYATCEQNDTSPGPGDPGCGKKDADGRPVSCDAQM